MLLGFVVGWFYLYTFASLVVVGVVLTLCTIRFIAMTLWEHEGRIIKQEEK